MVSNIDRDVSRARRILRGQVRKDLKKYINSGELIGRKGKDLVSIPIPNIEQPHFKFGVNTRGAAQGKGEPGDIVGKAGDGDDDGKKAGNEPGDHIIEEFSLEELAKMMGEELELPDLKMKGKRQLVSEGYRYSGSHPIGPESLRIGSKTLRRAILRSIMEIDPPEIIFDPNFIPSDYIYIVPPDKRYRIPKPHFKEVAMAVIIYIMDISGSMTDDMKQIVRQMCNWIEIWIDATYRGVAKRYIVHDASAWEVNDDTFYYTRQSGGTVISSAYNILTSMLNPNSGYSSPYGGAYSSDDLNIYVFQFTDGDNWGDDDNECLKILHKHILPKVNLFGYSQVKSPYSSGDFLEKVIKRLANNYENIAYTQIKDRDEIFDSIHNLLGKGAKSAKGVS